MSTSSNTSLSLFCRHNNNFPTLSWNLSSSSTGRARGRVVVVVRVVVVLLREVMLNRLEVTLLRVLLMLLALLVVVGWSYLDRKESRSSQRLNAHYRNIHIW